MPSSKIAENAPSGAHAVPFADDLPPPLVPAHVDLRDFGFMPLDVRRLLTSET